MKIYPKLGLSYDDVLLVPKKGMVESRDDVDLTTPFVKGFPLNLKVPIVSAPMSSVTNYDVAYKLVKSGAGVILHRNQTVKEQTNEWIRLKNDCNSYNRLQPYLTVGCAIGINEGKERFESLYKERCRIFCIDIAHGHSDKVASFIDSIEWGHDTFLIVGSIATPEAVEFFLERFDNIAAFRVGIGSGAACSTRGNTGFGVPQLTAVSECADAAGDIPIIADGSITKPSDACKALAAGASSVMIGSLLAGCLEAPRPGEYYGMASAKAKAEVGLESNYIEGASGKVSITGSIEDLIKRFSEGIRSGISYGGGNNIKTLQENAEFIQTSHNVKYESEVRVA